MGVQWVCRHLGWTALYCAVGLLVAGQPVAWGQEGTEAQNASHSRNVQAETVMKITAPFTVAAVGDIIEPQPLNSDDPRFQQLIQRIRRADVGFANMESTLVDFRTFRGPVAGIEAPVDMGEAIKAMGITIMNRANNHTFDGGVMGMVSTDEALDQLGIVHSGTGMDLQQARAAHYVETPKGRVGLVGMYSEEGDTKADATYRNGDIGGAPGLNALHLTAYHIVTPQQLQALREIAAANYGNRPDSTGSSPDRFRFFDGWYETGPDPGTIHYEMNPSDERGILESVRNGKVYSYFLIVTIHAHEVVHYLAQGRGGIDHAIPDFLIKLAHDSIDNGADMFVVHGVHALRGVEIYKDKPIFYDISNFVFQFGLQFGDSYDIIANEARMSADENPASQESVLTTSHFESGKLMEVRLYPVELGGAHRPLSQMGIPLTPDPEQAQRILKEVQEYSQPLGTTVSIEDNVGVIRVSTKAQDASKR